VAAAVAAQRSLADAILPDGERLKVRMGLHSGRGERGGDDYAGLDVHRAARIGAAAHGGQVLISDAARRSLGAAQVDRLLDEGASTPEDEAISIAAQIAEPNA
jgi:class 3 adenylate cyclase